MQGTLFIEPLNCIFRWKNFFGPLPQKGISVIMTKTAMFLILQGALTLNWHINNEKSIME